MHWRATLERSGFLPVGLALLSLALTAGLAVFAYLGLFSRYGADDYCFSRTLFKSGGLAQATVTWYLNTSNRYTTMPLVGISEWFGPSAIQYLPALAIFLWLGSLAWTLTRLSERLHFPTPRLMGFTLSALVVFFSILQAPNRYQSLYWRSGMVTYFTPLIAFSTLGGLILAETWRERPHSRAGWAAVLALVWTGFFLAGGLSETTLAIQGGALGLAILAVWFLARGQQRTKALWLLFTALSASVVALVVIFLAPANALRVRAFGPSPALTDVLLYSLIFAWDFMKDTFRSMPTPTLVSLVIAISIGFSLLGRSETNPKPKTVAAGLVAIPVITYVLIFFSMAPSMYGQHSYPGARALMATRALMVAGLLAFGLLIGIGLRREGIRRFVGSRPSSVLMLAAALFLMLSAAYPVYSAGQALDLLSWYRARAEQWDARDTYIRQAVADGATNLVVVQLDTIGGVQEYKENNWVNRCAAEFYGLNSLTAP